MVKLQKTRPKNVRLKFRNSESLSMNENLKRFTFKLDMKSGDV